MSDNQTTIADIYGDLMDVRAWLSDHLDEKGAVYADAVDELLAAITDKMDGCADVKRSP